MTYFGYGAVQACSLHRKSISPVLIGPISPEHPFLRTTMGAGRSVQRVGVHQRWIGCGAPDPGLVALPAVRMGNAAVVRCLSSLVALPAQAAAQAGSRT